MKITAEDARTLANFFRQLAVVMGDYRFENWTELSAAERREIEDAEWTLLTLSSDMTTRAVGIELDEAELSVSNVQKATADALRFIKKVKRAKQMLCIAGEALALAGAISSGQALAIGKAAAKLGAAVRDAAKEEKAIAS
jgi:hypothetical protein